VLCSGLQHRSGGARWTRPIDEAKADRKEDANMPTTREAMDAYVAAWDTADPEVRRRLLEQAMTEDGRSAYPSLEARGWEGIGAAIDAVRRQVPGLRVVKTSGIEEHHGWVRATWRMINADGSVRGDGEDVAELAGDGRLNRVIGFHDPLPPAG
jgi:hypothetical protein